MPRPTSKAELIKLSEENYNKLIEFIESLPEEYKIKKFENNELNERDKTISDVIMHLYEWHNMMQEWYKVGMSGEKPDIPAKGYTWKTLPAYNRTIWERYKDTDLKTALKKLDESHKKIMKLIEKHSDDDLFTRSKYQWTGNNALGAYIIGSASSHYDWALKTIKPIKKMIK